MCFFFQGFSVFCCNLFLFFLGLFQKLTVLKLDENELVSLPQSLGKSVLVALVVILVDGSVLCTCSVSSLTELSISKNKLQVCFLAMDIHTVNPEIFILINFSTFAH